MIIEGKDIFNRDTLFSLGAIESIVDVETEDETSMVEHVVEVHLKGGRTLHLVEPNFEELACLWAVYNEEKFEASYKSDPNGILTDEETEIISNPAYKVHHRYTYVGRSKKRSNTQ
jgi:hypothetical protein